MEASRIQLPWPDWRIVKELGHGGYGAVYQAERQLSGVTEEAAIKVISFPGSRDEIESDLTDGYDLDSIRAKYTERLQLYVNEYNIMKGLKGQTNIVSCDDFATIPHEDGIGWDVFIRMELLTPLTRVIRERRLSVSEIVKIGKDICRALILCESVNIIHRDIKPENIMVSRFGDYKLGDFGIAKTMDHTTNATMVGTERYMAPEVIRREPYGKEVDLYSLGLVLYWLLNNRRMPFLDPDKAPAGSEANEAQARRVRGDQLPPPRDGSAALKQVVLKACEFRPEDRYHSAKEMYDALTSAENGHETAPERDREETTGDEEEHTLPVWGAHPGRASGKPAGSSTSGGMGGPGAAHGGAAQPSGRSGRPGDPADTADGTETIPLYGANGKPAEKSASKKAGGGRPVHAGGAERAEAAAAVQDFTNALNNYARKREKAASPGDHPNTSGNSGGKEKNNAAKPAGTGASGSRKEPEPSDSQTATLLGSYPDDGYLKLVKIFLILGCVVMGATTVGIGLLWCIPITVSVCRKMKKHEPIGTGMKVAVLILVNLVAGVLMLAKENM